MRTETNLETRQAGLREKLNAVDVLHNSLRARRGDIQRYQRDLRMLDREEIRARQLISDTSRKVVIDLMVEACVLLQQARPLVEKNGVAFLPPFDFLLKQHELLLETLKRPPVAELPELTPEVEAPLPSEETQEAEVGKIAEPSPTHGHHIAKQNQDRRLRQMA